MTGQAAPTAGVQTWTRNQSRGMWPIGIEAAWGPWGVLTRSTAVGAVLGVRGTAGHAAAPAGRAAAECAVPVLPVCVIRGGDHPAQSAPACGDGHDQADGGDRGCVRVSGRAVPRRGRDQWSGWPGAVHRGLDRADRQFAEEQGGGPSGQCQPVPAQRVRGLWVSVAAAVSRSPRATRCTIASSRGSASWGGPRSACG
jgi:hypothetical protein